MRQPKLINALIVAIFILVLALVPAAFQFDVPLKSYRVYSVIPAVSGVRFSSNDGERAFDWEALAREHLGAVDLADLDEDDFREIKEGYSQPSRGSYRKFTVDLQSAKLGKYYYYLGKEDVVPLERFDLAGMVFYRMSGRDSSPRPERFFGKATAKLSEPGTNPGGFVFEFGMPVVFSMEPVVHRYEEGNGGWRLFPSIEDYKLTWTLNDGGEGRWTWAGQTEYSPNELNYSAFVFSVDVLPGRRFLFFETPAGMCSTNFELIEIKDKVVRIGNSYYGCSH